MRDSGLRVTVELAQAKCFLRLEPTILAASMPACCQGQFHIGPDQTC